MSESDFVEHPCWFCSKKDISLRRMAIHMIERHDGEHARLEVESCLFYRFATSGLSFYKSRGALLSCIRGGALLSCICGGGGTLLSCICGGFFTANSLGIGSDAQKAMPETNSFVAHLIREGGTAAHLEATKWKIIMDKIAGKK